MDRWINRMYDRLFPMPTPDEMAMRELQTAKRQLLESQSAQEYATAMVQYNMDRVARLESIVKGTHHA